MLETEAKVAELQELLLHRDSEIRAYDRQVLELSKQVACLESELEHCQEEKDAMKADLEATKELCNKLDNEKDKLKEELLECTDIRKKVFIGNIVAIGMGY